MTRSNAPRRRRNKPSRTPMLCKNRRRNMIDIITPLCSKPATVRHNLNFIDPIKRERFWFSCPIKTHYSKAVSLSNQKVGRKFCPVPGPIRMLDENFCKIFTHMVTPGCLRFKKIVKFEILAGPFCVL